VNYKVFSKYLFKLSAPLQELLLKKKKICLFYLDLSVKIILKCISKLSEIDFTLSETDFTLSETDFTLSETDSTLSETDSTLSETDFTSPEDDFTLPEIDFTLPETDFTSPEEHFILPETLFCLKNDVNISLNSDFVNIFYEYYQYNLYEIG